MLDHRHSQQKVNLFSGSLREVRRYPPRLVSSANLYPKRLRIHDGIRIATIGDRGKPHLQGPREDRRYIAVDPVLSFRQQVSGRLQRSSQITYPRQFHFSPLKRLFSGRHRWDVGLEGLEPALSLISLHAGRFGTLSLLQNTPVRISSEVNCRDKLLG